MNTVIHHDSILCPCFYDTEEAPREKMGDLRGGGGGVGWGWGT